MNLKKIMRASAASLLAVALMAGATLTAQAAPGDPLNPQPADSAQAGSKGGFFLYDGNTGEYADGNASRVYARNEILFASPSSSDPWAEHNYRMENGDRPITGANEFTQVWRFISDKNPTAVAGGTNTWKSFATDAAAGPTGGTLAPDFTLESINSNIEALITQGGSYWWGIAYTINSGVTTVGAVYREINIEAGTGNYTVSPVIVEGKATNTVLTSSASGVTSGATVELTATVSEVVADDAATFSGMVVFYDGETSIGTQAVTETAPTAAITTDPLSAGTHNFRAVFVPDSSAYSSSEGMTTVVASQEVAVQPAVALDSTNANGVTGTFSTGTLNVTLTTTTAESAVYVWQVKDGVWTNLGKQGVTGGQIVVRPTSSGPTQFVLAMADGTVVGHTTVDIATTQSLESNLVASVNANGQFLLVDRTIKANELSTGQLVNGHSQSTGKLGEVEVIDERYLTLNGWTLSTNVTEFKHRDSASVIAAANLGIKPEIKVPGVTAPDTVGFAPATLGAQQSAGSADYATGAVFAEAAEGTYSGSTVFDADLTFVAPEGSKKGKYDATLTLTLVSK
ncbi:Ig-like domain-containing protein [Tessaracoccus sp. Y36]